MEELQTTIFALSGIIIYFIPSWVANKRKAKSRLGIYLLNTLLGITAIGWVGALIWAVSGEVEQGGFDISNMTVVHKIRIGLVCLFLMLPIVALLNRVIEMISR